MYAARTVPRSIMRAASRARAFSASASAGKRVAVLGAAGGIGQPMSLLLKLDPNVTSLSLYDIQGSPGVAADIGHCCTQGTVEGFAGADQLDAALSGADLVIIPAGVPRKPGMTRDDLFNTNASIVKQLAEGCARACPEAAIGIISNPVNSTVPIAAEALKAAGVYNPKKLFGITTLDVVRANKFVGDSQSWDPKDVEVTVVGGHAGKTILPLLSRVQGAEWDQETLEKLYNRIQFGGDEVVQAKDGAGSATLSMAYAGARFANSLLRALGGEQGVTECAFVESSVTEAPFFSTRIELTTEGVGKIHEVGELSEWEQANFDEMMPVLQQQIQKGIDFAKAN